MEGLWPADNKTSGLQDLGPSVRETRGTYPEPQGSQQEPEAWHKPLGQEGWMESGSVVRGGFLEEVGSGLCGVQAVWEPLPMTRGFLSPL